MWGQREDVYLCMSPSLGLCNLYFVYIRTYGMYMRKYVCIQVYSMINNVILNNNKIIINSSFNIV